MARIYDNTRPTGIVPVLTLDGATRKHDYVPADGGIGLVISDSIAPYVGRGTKCAGNDDTCGANKKQGENYCAGHLRQQGVIK